MSHDSTLNLSKQMILLASDSKNKTINNNGDISVMATFSAWMVADHFQSSE